MRPARGGGEVQAQGTAPGNILIVSGPVGAGKTAVSLELVAAAVEPTAYIEGDTFWSHIVRGAKNQGRLQNFKTIMRAMTAAALPYALAGYATILDFSIPPWYLETVRRIASSKDVPVDYVVLRPSEAVCAARAAARADGTITDYSPYHDFYSDFEEAQKFTVGDDISAPAALAERIRAGASTGKFRLPS